MAKFHTSLVIALILSLLAPSHARLSFSFNSPENLAPSPLLSYYPYADLIPIDDQQFTPDAMPMSQQSQSDIVLEDDLELVITHKLSFRSVDHYNHHQMHMLMKQQLAWSRFPPHHGKHLVGPREAPYGDDIIDMILGDEKRSGEMVLNEHFGKTFDHPNIIEPPGVEVEDEDVEEGNDDKDQLYKEARKVEEEDADREDLYEEAVEVEDEDAGQEELEKPEESGDEFLTPTM